MAEKAKKKYRNAGHRNYHLSPRAKGDAHFVFAPGDVIEASSEVEAGVLENLLDVVEHKPAPKEAKE